MITCIILRTCLDIVISETEANKYIHNTFIPQVIEELRKLGREDIMVIAGGVIPAQDYDFLYKAFLATLRMNAQDEHGAPPK